MQFRQGAIDCTGIETNVMSQLIAIKNKYHTFGCKYLNFYTVYELQALGIHLYNPFLLFYCMCNGFAILRDYCFIVYIITVLYCRTINAFSSFTINILCSY